MSKRLITSDEVIDIARHNGLNIENDVYIKLKNKTRSFMLVAADVSCKPPYNELYRKSVVIRAVEYLSSASGN